MAFEDDAVDNRHPRPRIGKTAKDKQKGHHPFAKNTKGPGRRGHRGGK